MRFPRTSMKSLVKETKRPNTLGSPTPTQRPWQRRFHKKVQAASVGCTEGVTIHCWRLRVWHRELCHMYRNIRAFGNAGPMNQISSKGPETPDPKKQIVV